MNKNTATALVTLAVGTLVLTSCSGGDSKVSGLRDDLRQITAVAEKSHQEPKTKRVCTRSVLGKCKAYDTKPDGFKKVVDRKAKPAVWCVELDDVNGKPDDDDQWFEVTVSTYIKAADKNEGAKITGMEYRVSGCSQ